MKSWHVSWRWWSSSWTHHGLSYRSWQQRGASTPNWSKISRQSALSWLDKKKSCWVKWMKVDMRWRKSAASSGEMLNTRSPSVYWRCSYHLLTKSPLFMQGSCGGFGIRKTEAAASVSVFGGGRPREQGEVTASGGGASETRCCESQKHPGS